MRMSPKRVASVSLLGEGSTCDRALLDTDGGLLVGVVRKGGKEAVWQAQHSHPLSHDRRSRRKHEQKKKLILSVSNSLSLSTLSISTVSVSTVSVSTVSSCAFARFD